jgi:hypothetical protein
MTTPKTKKKVEAVLPQSLVNHLLEGAGPKVILVGGQALAYWAQYFGVSPPERMQHVSRDIDFLAESAADFSEVQRFSRLLGGYSIFPSKHSLTALVGQAVKEISEEEYFNIDVLYKVLSGTEGVRGRALEVHLNKSVFRVMHPLDVLASRLINLYKIPEKQTEIGQMQLDIAISIGREYLRHLSRSDDNSEVRASMKFITKLARSDAGRKVAKRWGLHVADSLDPRVRINDPMFMEFELDRISPLMSAAYQKIIFSEQDEDSFEIERISQK